MKGLMAVWKDIQTKTMCCSEHDNRNKIKMAIIKNNLVSTAKVDSENKCAEFTTFFRIPFNNVDPASIYTNNGIERWKRVFSAWSVVCIRALEARMDSCVSMLLRNYNNIVVSNESQIIFKKSNGQYHEFNHFSFQVMTEFKEYLENGNWELRKPNPAEVRQLLKALYWIPEKDKEERNGSDFGQLISCLEKFTF